jgi:hypothetical protein
MRSIPRDWERHIVDPRNTGPPSPRPATRPVWVHLDQLFAQDPARHQAVVYGLRLTGRVRGILLGWKRGSTGEWLAVVNYEIHYADGRPETTIWSEQLVPSAAVSPRDDNKPLG